uniref:Uncharacterized protein n=1 Tax=Peronospora matthiolae TaxID=2874970 RepID=A0AAV1T0F6_9STRA
MSDSPGRNHEGDLVEDSARKLDSPIPRTTHDVPPAQNDGNNEEIGELRRQVGRFVVHTQHTIDSHLMLFRMGLLVTVATSVMASLKLSGLLSRFDHVDDIPLWQFARRKKLRVRMVRQSRQDASVMYVYHTPLLRRTVLQDVLPSRLHTEDHGRKKKEEETKSDLIAIRPFGVRVDESSVEWIDSNFVSSHQYMTIQLLQRHVESSGSVAICSIALRRPLRNRDFAQELVSHGYAECIPEDLEKYDNGSHSANLSPLAKRLKDLKAAQKRAQIMQYGIWNDWQADKLTDRVFSVARTTIKGFQNVVDRIRH